MASIRHARKSITAKERYAMINDLKRKTQRIYLININKRKDTDIIGWLEQNKPYQGAIKWLVREQIKREEQQADLENLKETSR